jgi:hypothetical protein
MIDIKMKYYNKWLNKDLKNLLIYNRWSIFLAAFQNNSKVLLVVIQNVLHGEN